MADAQNCAWVQDTLCNTLPAFVRALCLKLPADNPGFSSREEPTGDDGFPLDPAKREYLEKLIQALYDARGIVASYNIAILVLISAFAFRHWQQSRSDSSRYDNRRWGQRQTLQTVALDRETNGAASSSSASTILGTATPPSAAAAKDDNVDLEQLPLLSDSHWDRSRRKARKPAPFSRAISSWLARQPPPLPVVNRALPSNGTSLFVTAWLVLNVFFHFYRLPLRWDYFFIFADRAGFLFVVNLPLLYFLSAKNQPFRLLTGFSYEALNIFHRRVGELMCFEAAVHFASMVVWQFVLAADWLTASTTTWEYFTHPLVLLGIGAFTSYELLYFTSLGGFRQRWYELFLASHVFLQITALVFLYFHFYTSRPYVLASLGIFLIDRFLWRYGLKRATLTADLTILEDGETFLLSADWDIPRHSEKKSPWWWPAAPRRFSITHGWQPTDHVFLTVPVLHGLQAHPFTIASAAPGFVTETAEGPPVHAWFTLLIRAHGGMTADLLAYAQAHSRVPVILDGPYGSSHALEMLRASDCAILVAGGSGIAVTFPLIWALLHDRQTGEAAEPEAVVLEGGKGGLQRQARQEVHLLWVTHSRSHRSWVPEQQLSELVARGLHLVIPEPTIEAGRPDVAGYVSRWIEGSAPEGRHVGVVVSGPDGLNRVTRNACADAIGQGLDVRVAVEKFGW
ncbi:hypothetical protein B0T25DRAFT_526659 [Lasiosphaeria hispida]|uniref:FAD-binding FR-type domain-containing protein n=1 Tax=Lasiosphaeria hispida TaxID=260671 RepID=A0AAJ0HUN9_9PEZI|nr:hypothetical protein B0T25DRAFT_526659 [Lasiosphaeria hispida]